MTDRAFDLMAGDLRRVIDEAERLGLDEPTMEVVDERKRYVILDARGNKVPESYYENRKDAEAFRVARKASSGDALFPGAE